MLNNLKIIYIVLANLSVIDGALPPQDPYKSSNSPETLLQHHSQSRAHLGHPNQPKIHLRHPSQPGV